MTDQTRSALLSACAFASVFLEAADAELRGASSERRVEASSELYAALEAVEISEERDDNF